MLSKSPAFYVFLVSFLAYLVPIIYRYFIIRIDIADVLNSLNKLENSYKPKPTIHPGPLILVGFGGCADITVRGTQLLKLMNLTAPDSKTLKQKWNRDGILNSLHDINLEFTHMFSEGAASEWSLGGNAAVMADRMAKEGCRVSLAARLSDRQKSVFPKGLRKYSALEKWGNYTSPRANRLILIRDEENPRISGLWDGLMHSWMHQSWPLAHEKAILPPDLFVLGGLQTMSNWHGAESPEFRHERLKSLQNFLKFKLPRASLVHFEMASFADEELSVNITKMLLPYVDSIGLNEQELPNLASLLRSGKVQTEATLSTPRAAVMLDLLRETWAILTNPSLPRADISRRRLSRIHLHTLGYQIIIVRRDPRHMTHEERQQLLRERNQASGRLNHIPLTDIGRGWPYVKAAAAKSSLIAHRYTCASASIDPVKTHLIMDASFAVSNDTKRWPKAGKFPRLNQNIPRVQFNSSDPVQCWFEDEPVEQDDRSASKPSADGICRTVQICISPGLVCKSVQKTAGAGDNISAGALAIQTVSSNNEVY